MFDQVGEASLPKVDYTLLGVLGVGAILHSTSYMTRKALVIKTMRSLYNLYYVNIALDCRVERGTTS